MNNVDDFKTSLTPLLEQRNAYLTTLSQKIHLVDALIETIKPYSFEQAAFEAKQAAQNLFKDLKAISEVESKLNEKIQYFKKLILKNPIESSLHAYKECVEKVHTFESTIFPEYGLIAFTKLFYKVHKKKLNPSDIDLFNLKIAKTYAIANFQPIKEWVSVQEKLKGEFELFEQTLKAKIKAANVAPDHSS